VVKTIVDVDTTQTSDFTDLPSGWSTPTGGGLHLLTEYVVDDQGRTTEVIDPESRHSYIVYDIQSRIIEYTDPDGLVTYTFYSDDAAHEVRIYPKWNTVTETPGGPTQVSRTDLANGYSESLTMTAEPHLTNGVPDGTEEIDDLQSLSRTFTNAAGQVVEQDVYFDLDGLSYSTDPYLGTVNTNYYATFFSYGITGLQERVELPSGTIQRTVSDGQGRVRSTWVGTDDTPESGDWSPSNPAGMVQLTAYLYDGGGVGDGNLTQVTQYPGGSAYPRVTQYFFDWRNQLVATKSGVQETENTATNRPISYTVYDNLRQAVEQQLYDGDQVTLSMEDGVPQAPSESLLRALTLTFYDEQGRVYRLQTFSVDPSMCRTKF
jgi:YD repeat-containing protein